MLTTVFDYSNIACIGSLSESILKDPPRIYAKSCDPNNQDFQRQNFGYKFAFPRS